MPSLAELLERRAYELRLTPDRALETLDDAEEFLHERGLMTRTEQSALPSLYEACHEDPYRPASRGFGQWPETKWPWFGELADREGAYALKIHRGKHMLFTKQVAALLDPILRDELARMHRRPTTGRSCSITSRPPARPRSKICARSSGSRRRR
jgi:hypothetical protein